MRHETAIAAAFKKADATVSHMQAYTLAAKMLKDVGGERAAAPPLALKKFLAAIEADVDLMRGCVLGFLQFVARDMKGDVTGQKFSDTQASSASASPHQRDGSDRNGSATHTIGVVPSHSDRDGADHETTDTHGFRVRPVREPSTAQKQAAGLARLQMAESVLQTFKVRDGRAIAKVWRSEISDMIGENWRENAILDRVRKVPLPRGANDEQVGNYVSDGMMKRIIAEVDGSLAAQAARGRPTAS